MQLASYQPKQKRSEQSLQNIIDAILQLVEHKYFEKITIAEIVAEANMSAGAFYRRFRSKEDALPVIYHRFQLDLREWLDSRADDWRALELADLIADMSDGIFHFVEQRRGLFRTIHLNARLNSDYLPPQTLEERVNDFITLSGFFQPFYQASNQEAERAVRYAIFAMVSLAIEKAVYPAITPASGTPQNFDESINATSEMLTQYLSKVFSHQD